MRVLVTGGEGLVGSAVVAHLLAHGADVTTLTLPDATPHDGVRVVRGDARDPDAVAAAADGVDGVAHLAAIPSPYEHPAHEVFGNNALATFTVLWAAAERGVRRFVVAGSVNATGLIMNPHRPLPPRYPVDEDDPVRRRRPVLTVQTGRRAHAARGLPALRRVRRRPAAATDGLGRQPRPAARLGGRQRARRRRRRLGLAGRAGRGGGVPAGADRGYDGCHVVHVAAPDTFQDAPTGDLLRAARPGRAAR